jgi:hypothetical protein
MDGSDFDTLARSFAHSGTRRRLVNLLLALPLGGVLTTLGGDEAVAQQRPIDRIQRRTPQRNRNQRNNNNKNNNNKNNNKKGGGGGQNSGNRLQNPTTCRSAADCEGQACCSGTCCQPPANQCNHISGLCCAPNCSGRQCGPDGCGNTGQCGTCTQCQTCNEVTGQCSPVANGTPCNDGNPLCVNGRCCTAGHEVVHGGCFQINSIDCQGCNAGCGGCAGSIDGSPNFLCVSDTPNRCQSNADCPVGQACQGEVKVSCVQPC